MKIIKVENCGSCPYIYAMLIEDNSLSTHYKYFCEFGKYLKKDGGTIRTNVKPKYLHNNLNKISKWCPLEDYYFQPTYLKEEEANYEKPA